MQKKIIWLVLSSLMILSLVLASCAPATPTTPTVPTTPTAPSTPTTPTTPTTPAQPTTTETPKYGGMLIDVLDGVPPGFDDSTTPPSTIHSFSLTHDDLLNGDWSRGPAGTKEVSFEDNSWVQFEFQIGELAESWEVPDPSTIIYHLRQGVHFGLNPNSEASRLVNGREMTADDVVASFTRVLKIKSSYLGSNVGGWFKSVTAADKYTVVFKGEDSPTYRTAKMFELLSEEHNIWPREVLDKYGDTKDWRNVVGTGAFLLTEYVGGSSLNFVRNPNYWMKDPVGPGKGNQLPYLDRVKWLIITDYSTRLAALRTAKIDTDGYNGDIYAEDMPLLTKSHPELKSKRLLIVPQAIYLRTDIKPFDDIRVRRALSMAVDKQAIARDYFGGDAEILTNPVRPGPSTMGTLYTPIDQLPEAAKEFYTFNPDKAKNLLAEAGYPNGFTFTLTTYNSRGYLDLAAIIKDYLAKISVNMEIDLKDSGVYMSMRNGHTYKYAVQSSYAGGPFLMRYFTPPGSSYNYCIVDDPYINDLSSKVWAFENIGNAAERNRLAKEYAVYSMSQGWYIDYPTPYKYNVWWPWVKNYYGITGCGASTFRSSTRFIWLDQELKKSMGY